MELQNHKFGRSLRDSLLYWFLEATETFFQRRSSMKVHNVRQIKVEYFSLLLWTWQGGLQEMASICLLSSPLAQHLQGSNCPVPQMRKRRLLRGGGAHWSPRASQWQSWDWKPGCHLPCDTRAHVQLELQLVCMAMWAAGIWRNTSSAAPRTSQVNMKSGNNWLFHLWPGPRQPETYTPLPPPFLCWPQGQGQRSWARWKVGPWNAQGTRLAAIGNQSQPCAPSASLAAVRKSLTGWSYRGGWFHETLQHHLGGRFSRIYKFPSFVMKIQQTKRKKGFIS